ncbi:hypothetical protein chiPu_0028371, partial [Chiloscyllium punctatum]|nr:hypothetical protein [Chiloscyllium punctatum]
MLRDSERCKFEREGGHHGDGRTDEAGQGTSRKGKR